MSAGPERTCAGIQVSLNPSCIRHSRSVTDYRTAAIEKNACWYSGVSVGKSLPFQPVLGPGLLPAEPWTKLRRGARGRGPYSDRFVLPSPGVGPSQALPMLSLARWTTLTTSAFLVCAASGREVDDPPREPPQIIRSPPVQVIATPPPPRTHSAGTGGGPMRQRHLGSVRSRPVNRIWTRTGSPPPTRRVTRSSRPSPSVTASAWAGSTVGERSSASRRHAPRASKAGHTSPGRRHPRRCPGC